ncbi:F-box/LRR-repeat protein 2 [Strongylocentrotus purpuratus]|uniref:F-box/LRR-repeat protein 15-like leucin rich repeat domain-containing protein n=1 Tax=Strongylocentrotus purpuratus TaxID=7668 RepID=A0A7M7NVU1_STRPU|nr:F-box/LRR-repeat protein 2 [Strongylocentrotus purpuratus]
MVKQLMDMCLGCIAQNLHAISNVGKHLPTLHKEKILQWVVDHNMLTTEYVPHVTYHLFSPALRSISFNDCDQITDKLLIQLDACKCVLESITIDGCKVTDVGVSALLSHQVELQTLVLKELSELTGTGLEVLRSRKLKEVELFQCINITNKSLVALVTRNPTIARLNLCSCYKLTHEIIPTIAVTLANELEHLDLSSIHTIDNNDLVVLSQHCKILKGIVLHGCNRITSAGVMALSKECTKLQLLDVSFCYKLQESSSKDFLKELPVSLKNLVLSGLQLEGGDIHTAVARLPKLETLRLCGINSIPEEDAIKIFETVGPQLICLDMTGCHQIMTDDILRLIVKNCKVLEDLCLAFCMKLTGEPLRMLFRDQERSSNLTLLRMSGCKDLYHDILLDMSKACVNLNKLYMAGIKSVDDTLLFSIANHMPHLKNISLKSCVGSSADQVTDNGVVELTRCCPLEDICLAGIHNITDKSIFALANNCPDLKTLFVSGCSKVTTQATNYLQDVCNDKVYVYHRLPNANPNLVMAKNLDTGDFCQIDQTKWSMM